MQRDTIYALSSAPGRAGIAVLRVSGPRAGVALESLTEAGIPEPRRATLRRLVEAGEEIDQALVLWFPAGRVVPAAAPEQPRQRSPQFTSG